MAASRIVSSSAHLSVTLAGRTVISWRGAISVVVEDAGGHAGVDADPLVGQRWPPVVGGEDGLEVGHGEAPAEQIGDVVEADLEVAGVGLELQVGHAVGDPEACPEVVPQDGDDGVGFLPGHERHADVVVGLGRRRRDGHTRLLSRCSPVTVPGPNRSATVRALSSRPMLRARSGNPGLGREPSSAPNRSVATGATRSVQARSQSARISSLPPPPGHPTRNVMNSRVARALRCQSAVAVAATTGTRTSPPRAAPRENTSRRNGSPSSGSTTRLAATTISPQSPMAITASTSRRTGCQVGCPSHCPLPAVPSKPGRAVSRSRLSSEMAWAWRSLSAALNTRMLLTVSDSDSRAATLSARNSPYSTWAKGR